MRHFFFIVMLALIVGLSIASCAQNQVDKIAESRQHEETALYLRLQGNLNDALAEQQKAVELNPQDSPSLTLLASIYDEIGSEQNNQEYLFRAREFLERAIKADPSNAVAHDMLGDSFFIIKFAKVI